MNKDKASRMESEQLEKLRNDPNVVHHRRRRPRPFEPAIRITGPLTVRELIGWCDEDEVDSRSAD